MSFSKFRISLALVALLALGGCGSVANWVTPYKIDILQGNVITREQVEALKPGMPREQVRDILGSPLLASVFTPTAGTTSSPCSAGARSRCAAE